MLASDSFLFAYFISRVAFATSLSLKRSHILNTTPALPLDLNTTASNTTAPEPITRTSWRSIFNAGILGFEAEYPGASLLELLNAASPNQGHDPAHMRAFKLYYDVPGQGTFLAATEPRPGTGEPKWDYLPLPLWMPTVRLGEPPWPPIFDIFQAYDVAKAAGLEDKSTSVEYRVVDYGAEIGNVPVYLFTYHTVLPFVTEYLAAVRSDTGESIRVPDRDICFGTDSIYRAL